MSESAFKNELAERSVLAFIVIDSSGDKYVPQLTADLFSVDVHKQLFAAMQRLYAEKKPVDLVTMSDELKAMYGFAEQALMNALMEIVTQNKYPALQFKQHVEVLKAAALRRRLYEEIEKAKKDLLDEKNDAAVILDSTRQALRDMVVTSHSWMSMADVLLETFTTLEKRSKGEEPCMPSGISDLDHNTTGFHKGELTILGARPAVGKSALAAHIALNAAEKGYKVAICSREMTAVQYGQRVITRAANIDNTKLRTGEIDADDWAQICDAVELYGSYNVNFMFSTRYIEDLRMEVQKQVDANNLDMLVVDYVQLMQSKQRFDKDYLRIAYISKMLKDMTVDYDISILALAQVGRSSQGTMPTLAELRGSGDLEQDADNVIFMHRPTSPDDKYVRPDDRECFNGLEMQGLQYISINIAKQRQGTTGTVPVIFNPKRMQFTAISRREAE
jgi:replicative DNA helicase